jgi:hypothetical protein
MAAPSRFASRSTVKMLIDMKNYSSAAEVVSDSKDTYAQYSSTIKDVIARSQELPANVKFVELQRVLDTARDEILQDQEWERDMLEALPAEDDQNGATGLLRRAFSSAAIERNKLLSEMMSAHEPYLKAQVEVFKLD